MQHAITIGDLVWWSSGVVVVLVAIGLVVGVFAAVAGGFKD